MGLDARCNKAATLADQLACCWTTDGCNNTSKDAQAFDPAFGYICIKHDNLPSVKEYCPKAVKTPSDQRQGQEPDVQPLWVRAPMRSNRERT